MVAGERPHLIWWVVCERVGSSAFCFRGGRKRESGGEEWGVWGWQEGGQSQVGGFFFLLFFFSFPPLFLPCLLLLAEIRVLPFYILHLIWRCSLFPLIDLLEAAKLSSVAPLACSSFLHFLYKEMEGGGRDLGHC